jgi:hypothetical protein
MPAYAWGTAAIGLHSPRVTLFGVGTGILQFAFSLFRSRAVLTTENLFLRKQLAFYQVRQATTGWKSTTTAVC